MHLLEIFMDKRCIYVKYMLRYLTMEVNFCSILRSFNFVPKTMKLVNFVIYSTIQMNSNQL